MEITLLTLGIDLASQPKKTAGCLVAWTAHDADVSTLELGLTDDDILSLAERADVVAIDAPFGWSQPFIDFVSESPVHREASVWDAISRDRLCFRRTDLHVRRLLGRPPLSVSSDKIAVTAMRCAGLLSRLGVTDRSGAGRVVEVYPAVALHMWGFASRRYKTGTRALRHREGNLVELVSAVTTACPWLRQTDETLQVCSRNDDAFDALLSILLNQHEDVLDVDLDLLDQLDLEDDIVVDRSSSLLTSTMLAGGGKTRHLPGNVWLARHS